MGLPLPLSTTHAACCARGPRGRGGGPTFPPFGGGDRGAASRHTQAHAHTCCPKQRCSYTRGDDRGAVSTPLQEWGCNPLLLESSRSGRSNQGDFPNRTNIQENPGRPPTSRTVPGARPVLPQGREAKQVPDRGSRRRCLARSQGPRRELRGGRAGLGSPAGALRLHSRHRGTGSRPNSRAAPRRPEPGQAHPGAAGSHVRRVSTPTSVVCVARPWSCTMPPEQQESRKRSHGERKRPPSCPETVSAGVLRESRGHCLDTASERLNPPP